MTTKCYLIQNEYTALAFSIITNFFNKHQSPYIYHTIEYDDYTETTITCLEQYARDVENLLQKFV